MQSWKAQARKIEGHVAEDQTKRDQSTWSVTIVINWYCLSFFNLVLKNKGRGRGGGGLKKKGRKRELIWNDRGFIEDLRYIKNELFN